jgi:hypothetical protein
MIIFEYKNGSKRQAFSYLQQLLDWRARFVLREETK